MGRIFGTDGARGVANTEISCKLAMNIGRATAMVVAQEKKRKVTFLVGKDTRISSDMLECAITAGLCSVGADVIQVGYVPTPAVAYLVKDMKADGGIMLSFEYNGIKIFGGNGFKLTDDEEFEIEEIVLDHTLPYDIKWDDELGRITQDHSAVDKYVDHIVSTVDMDLSGYKIALDCSNGSASATAEKIFSRLNADVTIISSSPNGVNINNNCGSTHIGQLSKFVADNGFDMGFAFDGDADRCLAVDADGNLVDGDKIIAILSGYFKSQNKLKNDAAVVTLMSNMGFFKFAKENGITAEMTKVGDRYVLERLIEKDYTIGGEQSGHVIFRDYMT
ncbi:MAG: phosphoglucosamine mutase, partial [Oscillospiraceae bacterium]